MLKAASYPVMHAGMVEQTGGSSEKYLRKLASNASTDRRERSHAADLAAIREAASTDNLEALATSSTSSEERR